LDDVQGALWTFAIIEATRVRAQDRPELTRIVIGVDPNASDSDDADEFGIVASGRGVDGDIYVLADASGQFTGEAACRAVWALWWRLGGTAEVVYEGNKGGIWVAKALADVWKDMRKEGQFPGVYGHPPIAEVTATEDKATRAVPVSVLYPLGRIHHVGVLEQLETEQTTWDRDSGQDSPNRLDALVWTVIRLEQAGGPSQISRPAPGRLPTLPAQPRFTGLGSMPRYYRGT
jgi:phage terminase large subunit-like protein